MTKQSRRRLALALATCGLAALPVTILAANTSPATSMRLAASAEDTSRQPASLAHASAAAAGPVIYGWGNNDNEQATGKFGYVYNPTLVSFPPLQFPSPVVALSAGNKHSLALLADGTVWSWGASDLGQVGHTGPDVRKVQTFAGFPDLSGIAGISAGGDASLVVGKDGQVWAWGNNAFGQIGIGHNDVTELAQPVPGATDVVAVSAGATHSLALKRDGTVLAWGANDTGELGDGTWTYHYTPTPVPGLTDVVAIAAGNHYSLALKKDGTVMAWGSNNGCQLGYGQDRTHWVGVSSSCAQCVRSWP